MPSRPRQFQQQRRTIAIVASQYNPEFVEGLTSHTERELTALLPDGATQLFQVPGAFEIPLMVQELAERTTFAAIIALGVVIQGQTAHARLIVEAVTRALLEISLKHHVPVIHEVLLLEDDKQACARCLEPELNRGTEAARAAVRMIQALSDSRGR
jgi:6,7-dimethyl-8-ribityllumazine synthase